MGTFKTVMQRTRTITESVYAMEPTGMWSFAFGFIIFFTGLVLLLCADVHDKWNSVGLIIMGALSLGIVTVKILAFVFRRKVTAFDLVRASYAVRGLLRATAFVLMTVMVLPQTGHVGGIFWGCVDCFLLVSALFCLSLYFGPFLRFVKSLRRGWRQAWFERHVVASLPEFF